MFKAIAPVLFGLVLCGTTLGAPANAHDQAHEQGHREPVVIPGECPDRGDNTVRWVNVRGRHALSLFTDGSNWSGFEIFANSPSLAHGKLPNSPTLLPTGTFSFRVLSASTPVPDFYIDAYSANDCFTFGGGGYTPGSNNVLSVTVPPNTLVLNIYLNNSGPSSAIVSDFKFNGRPLSGTTVVDKTNTNAFNFCAEGQAPNCN